MEQYIFGIDVGGTTVKSGLFDRSGKIIEKWESPTGKSDGGKQVIPALAADLSKCLERNGLSRENISGIGLGVPSIVDRSGNVCCAANIGWRDYNPKTALESLLKIPVVIDKDVNFAALGEMKYGCAKGYDDLVFITLGTGLGCAAVSDGKLIKGAFGAAGELGHICIDPRATEPCNCGLCGCLEQYASATGLVNIAKKHYAESELPKTLTAKDILTGAGTGNPPDCAAVKEFAEYLGKGIAIIRAIVDPQIVIIGGGISNAGQMLIDPIKSAFEKYAFKPHRVEFALASLKNDAGIYGAMSVFAK